LIRLASAKKQSAETGQATKKGGAHVEKTLVGLDSAEPVSFVGARLWRGWGGEDSYGHAHSHYHGYTYSYTYGHSHYHGYTYSYTYGHSHTYNFTYFCNIRPGEDWRYCLLERRDGSNRRSG
jgi:hypothetical protein